MADVSADPIVYCLEQRTDYLHLERLCSDLMSESGYANIEPLGGTNDKGRDALHVSRSDEGTTTIFAYSVRDDWQQKLKLDPRRIRDEGHEIREFVFVCTATISATERDVAIKRVSDDNDWRLELYGLERIRVLLSGLLLHLVANHPAIFCPPFFSGGRRSLPC